ncbi:MAG TPA: hypothetical protein DHV14_08550 [Micrococcales bacterium]|nr:hypothetical protein [Micrococcales bacterium]
MQEATGDATPTPDPAGAGTDAAPGADAEEFLALMRSGLDAYTTARVSTTIEGGSQVMTISSQIDYTKEPTAMVMTMENMGPETVEAIFVDGQVYLRAASVTGDGWRVTDRDALGLDLSSSDPLAQMHAFEGALIAAERVGEEMAAGVPTTHYSVVIDSARMAESGRDTTAMPPEVPYELWLDEQGRVVQMIMDLGSAGRATMTMTELDQPVDISAPAADQIVRAPVQG